MNLVGIDIVDLLHSLGLGVKGTSLFVGEISGSAPTGIGVHSYPGPSLAQDRTHNRLGQTLERPRFQVDCRAPEYAIAGSKAYEIYERLTKLGTFIVNNTRYLSVLPVTTPGELPRDENNRAIFVTSYEARREVP